MSLTFVSRIRHALIEARHQRGWSQGELAERLGTTQVNVSRWERGTSTPGPYFRQKLTQLLGLPEQDLLQKSAPPHTKIPHIVLYDSAIPDRLPTQMVGRTRELEQVKSLLLTGGAAAITAVDGLPGIGKTTLATELLYDQRIQQHFSDGILWAGLGPQPNVLGLLSRWGTLLGVVTKGHLITKEDWAYALRSAIGRRRILLVIDDAWHIEDALAFRVGGPEAAYLLTTRLPLLAQEFAPSSTMTLHELTASDGIALLGTLAPKALELEREQSHSLVQAVGGLPLALTLMGNYLRALTHAGQQRRATTAMARLSDAGERLRLSLPDQTTSAAQTPISLERAIATSDEHLDRAAQTALRCLAILPTKPESFPEEMALAVAACGTDTIDALIDSGLLESRAPGRYSLHQTIADYARSRLSDRQAARSRLVNFIADLVERQHDFDVLEQDSTSILMGLEAAFDLGKQGELCRAICAFSPFLLARGLFSLAEIHLRRVYEASDVATLQEAKRAWVLRYLGETAWKQGAAQEAEAYAQEGLGLARRANDRDLVCALLNLAADLRANAMGEHAQAELYAREGLELARAGQQSEWMCALGGKLGLSLQRQGKLQEADACYQEAITTARQFQHYARLCELLDFIGVLHYEQGDFPLAERYFEEGLVLARQHDQRQIVTNLLQNLGQIAHEQYKNQGREDGRFSRALSYYEEVQALARQTGNIDALVGCLAQMSDLVSLRGDFALADALTAEGLDLARQAKANAWIISMLDVRAGSFLDRHDLASARQCYEELLDLASGQGPDALPRAIAYWGLAHVAEAEKDFQAAHAHAEASLAILKARNHFGQKEVSAWIASLPPLPST